MIETYLMEDSEKMISDVEHLEEWTKIVEELGLTGQQALAKPAKSPIPFLPLNEISERVYGTLCKFHTSVKIYKRSTIPLRILSLIALSENEKYFHHIEIWDDNDPDPVVIGYVNDTYSSPKFLIGRWGDELRSFEELKQIAKKKWSEEKIAELTEKLNNIQTAAIQWFDGKWISI